MVCVVVQWGLRYYQAIHPVIHQPAVARVNAVPECPPHHIPPRMN